MNSKCDELLVADFNRFCGVVKIARVVPRSRVAPDRHINLLIRSEIRLADEL